MSTLEIAQKCLPYLERLLALQGDQAEPELILLQHELAALITRENS
jgi:hypothetical protein